MNRRRPRIHQSKRTKRRAARARQFGWRFKLSSMTWVSHETNLL